MPKLGQKKSSTGCKRCKQRKVKCDEQQPTCGDCQRHQLLCVYQNKQNNSQRATPHHRSQSTKPARSQPQNGADAQAGSLTGSNESTRSPKSLLELRLLHNYTAYTCKTASAALHVWKDQAPRLAFRYSYLLDALLANSALHLSCIDPDDSEASDACKEYFDRGLAGYRKALENITPSNIHAVLLTSAVIGKLTFHLTGNSSDSEEALNALQLWLWVAKGTKTIMQQNGGRDSEQVQAWVDAFGDIGEFRDRHALFNPANRKGFENILEFGRDFEVVTKDDLAAYEDTLAYIGRMHTIATEKSEEPMTFCRRIFAFPNPGPDRFVELVAERRPRALVIMAYFFAGIKKMNLDLWWVNGVPEQQIPGIYKALPPGWQVMMQEPLRLVGMELTPPG